MPVQPRINRSIVTLYLARTSEQIVTTVVDVAMIPRNICHMSAEYPAQRTIPEYYAKKYGLLERETHLEQIIHLECTIFSLLKSFIAQIKNIQFTHNQYCKTPTYQERINAFERAEKDPAFIANMQAMRHTEKNIKQLIHQYRSNYPYAYAVSIMQMLISPHIKSLLDNHVINREVNFIIPEVIEAYKAMQSKQNQKVNGVLSDYRDEFLNLVYRRSEVTNPNRCVSQANPEP